MTIVRTRFSPSPTGKIHLGNARAALFSALYAKHHNGVFVLRIEDTDAARSSEAFVDILQNNLHWLGVKWQEGPGVNGDYGPYWQSQRQAIYAKHYETMTNKGLMYPCFCSDKELAVARKIQLSSGKAPRYSRKCKALSKEEIDARLAAGEKPAWRFSVPEGKEIKFTDLVKGEQIFQSDDIGDFVIRRADLTSPFLFCNAVDDAMMKVTHVLRGEDHVANTPRQLLILDALKLTPPQYGHLSLIVGDDGSPLSKRHGSFSLEQLHNDGYLPEAIMNYLARLGHASDNNELQSFSGLSHTFDLNRLSKSPAKFDMSQLNFWQKTAVQLLDVNSFWRWVGEKIQNQVPIDMQHRFAEVIKMNILFPVEVSDWADIITHDGVAINNTDAAYIVEAGEQFFVEAEQAVEQYGTDIKAVLNEMKQTLGVKGKKLFKPVRIALTGREHGPELSDIAELLGKEKLKHRFGEAFKIASDSQ